jgi:hypothetical protein
MDTCQGCGVELPPSVYQGRKRKWCSERCRKQTMYGGACIDCGAEMNGSAGNGPDRPVRCGKCNAQRAGEYQSALAQPRYDAIIRLRAQGLRDQDIADIVGYEHVGSVRASVLRLRQRGVVVATSPRGRRPQEQA